MATQQIVGAGTYQNISNSSGAWQPPACNYVTLVLSQVNTTRAIDTAVLSGTMWASQDGVNWRDAGDFSASFGFVDTTQINPKTGTNYVAPDAIFGCEYAPYLKISFTLAGKVTIAGITLVTN